ncbi:MAG TPA: amidohydrolase [Vicinamibacterales bacterium]
MSRRPVRSAIATLAAAAAFTVACSAPAPVAADLVITHASIWTGNPAQPSASALAIIGDRIVDVGDDRAIERWRGGDTVVIDAEGRRLVPGFNDAHVHFADGGTALDNVDLRDADSQAEFVRRISERVKARQGEWIVGGAWDNTRWRPATLPTRQMIDDATNGTPVFVTRYDGRTGLANSAALGRAGVTTATADPHGGAIVRDPATGFPTGVLTDAAMSLVAQVIPKTSPERRVQIVKRALEYAASMGVTSVQDMNPDPEDVSVLADLAERGELTTRVYAAMSDAAWYDQAKLGIHRAFGSPWLRIGAVVGLADDGLVAETTPTAEMRIRLMAADHAGLQLSLQADTQAGVSRALSLFDEVAQANGKRDRRARIEHAGSLAPHEVERLAALDVIASIQPARDITTDALRRLLDGGVRLAIGTDWSIAPLNPMLALYAAVTVQKMSIAEAMKAYTNGSAFAEFQEGQKGTLARGRLADLVILSDDIFSIPAARLRDVHVLTTIVGGRVVHRRNP